MNFQAFDFIIAYFYRHIIFIQGCPAQVQVKNGAVYDGIFKTYSEKVSFPHICSKINDTHMTQSLLKIVLIHLYLPQFLYTNR